MMQSWLTKITVTAVASSALIFISNPSMEAQYVPYVNAAARQSSIQNIDSIIFQEAQSFQHNKQTSRQTTDWILSASRKTDVDPLLLTAVVEAESGFRAALIGKEKRIGLMQLTQETAAKTGQNVWHPSGNVLAGAILLAEAAQENHLETFDNIEKIKRVLDSYF